MELTIVGSGTLLPDDLHRSAGHLLEWEEGSLLLDCGSGVLHGLARDERDWRRISHLAISHFHTDHIGDIAPLLWAWKHGNPDGGRRARTLLGPPGLPGVLRALADAHGSYVLAPGGPLEVVELTRDDRWEDAECGLVVRTHPARHTEEAVAFHVQVGETCVGYTGDTGPHPTLAEFFRGVDLLVAECAVDERSGVEIHLSPTAVAELAKDVGPRTLVLTHLYPTIDRRTLVDRMRSLGVTSEVFVADDGLRIRL